MNTLVLNGSPHKNGDSMELLNEMMRHLDGNVDIFSAYLENQQVVEHRRLNGRKKMIDEDRRNQEAVLYRYFS